MDLCISSKVVQGMVKILYIYIIDYCSFQIKTSFVFQTFNTVNILLKMHSKWELNPLYFEKYLNLNSVRAGSQITRF